ncbi:MAG: DUF2958 domain-containing protein [Planctomycetota bacterium]
MSLLTAELRRELPPLYTTERDADALVWAKFFTPRTNWTWYVLEFDGEDLFFGLVDGHEIELGYFSLNELESIRGPGGLTIGRDLYFKPVPISKIKSMLESRGAETPRLPFPGQDRGRDR